MDLKQLFLSGDERFLTALGNQTISNKYSPFNPNILSRYIIREIIRSDSQIGFAKTLWLANVGRNGITVNYNREVSEKTKERIQRQTLAFLEANQINFSHLLKDYVSTLFEEGNAVFMLNNDNQLIVQSIFNFKVYHDSLNKVNKYTLLDEKRQKVPGYIDLRQGEGIYHIKDPLFSSWAVAPSRFNLLYLYLMLENSAVKSNVKLFQNGAINLTLLKLDPALAGDLNQIDPRTITKQNSKGLSFIEIIMKRIRDFTAGVRNANGIQQIAGLDDVFELGKDNKDMQFVELIKDIAPEKKAWAFSTVMPDYGAGGNATYNNTQTYSYALYDKIGRHAESEFMAMLNNFGLKQLGLQTEYKGEYYVNFNQPTNPDWQKQREINRLDWVNNAITLNQYLETQDRPPVDNGDVYYSEWTQILASGLLPDQENEQEEQIENSKKKVKNSVRKTKASKAIRSKNGKKLVKEIDKAIKKQVTDWANGLKRKPSKVKLPKISNYLSVDDFSELLKPFAGIALEELENNTGIKNAFIGEYPDFILQAISERSFFILEGGRLKDDISELSKPLFQDFKNFAGIDQTTSELISTFVASMAEQPLPEIVKAITSEVSDLSAYRASLIATTEITNTIEGTKYMLYEKETNGEAKLEWQAILDENTGDDHRQNDGEIRKIGEAYPSGETRPGQRPNCRCQTVRVFD